MDSRNLTESTGKNIINPVVGEEFENLTELEKYYQEYATQEGFSWMKRSCKKNKAGVRCNVTFACSRSGSKASKNSEQPKSKKPKTVQTGCESCMGAALDPFGSGRWAISVFRSTHNHKLSPGKKKYVIEEKVKPLELDKNKSLELEICIENNKKNKLKKKRFDLCFNVENCDVYCSSSNENLFDNIKKWITDMLDTIKSSQAKPTSVSETIEEIVQDDTVEVDLENDGGNEVLTILDPKPKKKKRGRPRSNVFKCARGKGYRGAKSKKVCTDEEQANNESSPCIPNEEHTYSVEHTVSLESPLSQMSNGYEQFLNTPNMTQSPWLYGDYTQLLVHNSFSFN
ncbi:hypothetical protein MKX01_003071 [Papaver californicum]|nr:hypothetical protein MKX01_003071 [Papaver californicum]